MLSRVKETELRGTRPFRWGHQRAASKVMLRSGLVGTWELMDGGRGHGQYRGPRFF